MNWAGWILAGHFALNILFAAIAHGFAADKDKKYAARATLFALTAAVQVGFIALVFHASQD